ncbi:AAA family ATPase [Microbacterium album]|uniref:Pilus biosynthesis protein CpaE n=1 Tax=Microbacterium album TaxID=2053191 RepID=A0A917IDE3_9MICO|nr:P-loop NTPase [Microbacterium album]GGH37780.1 pilus biosynthesis protein CpaE [Microbacterium album]
MIALVAAERRTAVRLAEELRDEGATVLDTLEPGEVAVAAERPDSEVGARLASCDTLVLAGGRGVLSEALVTACDRLGVRIVVLADHPSDIRAAHAFGLADPLPGDAEGRRVMAAASALPRVEPRAVAARRPGRMIAVWGPAGAPGRTTVAIELAVELARRGQHVALVDADTHAPAIAPALGLADEGPGFAAACRQAESGLLDAAELLRVSVPLGDPDGRVDVLTGINRTARWPELSHARVAAAVGVLRQWADAVVADVAAPLETDEEIVSDLDGPRRNAAALAVLAEADLVVAVASGDPVGVARFVRGHAELRRAIGATPVRVVVNRVRSGPLGVDPRGQVRRALERFAGLTDVSFIPYDRRASDAALLAARPVGEVAPRSGLAQAVRRLAATVAPDARRQPASRRSEGAVRRRRSA